MFIPHMIVPRRRGRRKATPRERLAGIAASVTAVFVSAGIGLAFSERSPADAVTLACIVTGFAFVGGIVVAKLIGRSGKI